MKEILACTWKPAVPFLQTAQLGAAVDGLEPPLNEHENFWQEECQQHPNSPACRLFDI